MSGNDSIGEFGIGDFADDTDTIIALPYAIALTLSLNAPIIRTGVTIKPPAIALSFTVNAPAVLVATRIILPGPVQFTFGKYQTVDTAIEEFTDDGSIGEFAIGEADHSTQTTTLTHPIPEIQARTRAVRIRTKTA